MLGDFLFNLAQCGSRAVRRDVRLRRGAVMQPYYFNVVL